MKIHYYITLRDFMLCVSVAGMFALVFGVIAGMLAARHLGIDVIAPTQQEVRAVELQRKPELMDRKLEEVKK